jgi:hypothetical protein
MGVWAGIATDYELMVRGSVPGGGKIFLIPSDFPCGPPSLVCNVNWVPFPGVKGAGRGVDQLPHRAPRLKYK